MLYVSFMITTNQTLIIDTEKIKRKESKCTTIENHEIQIKQEKERDKIIRHKKTLKIW